MAPGHHQTWSNMSPSNSVSLLYRVIRIRLFSMRSFGSETQAHWTTKLALTTDSRSGSTRVIQVVGSSNPGLLVCALVKMPCLVLRLLYTEVLSRRLEKELTQYIHQAGHLENYLGRERASKASVDDKWVDRVALENIQPYGDEGHFGGLLRRGQANPGQSRRIMKTIDDAVAKLYIDRPFQFIYCKVQAVVRE